MSPIALVLACDHGTIVARNIWLFQSLLGSDLLHEIADRPCFHLAIITLRFCFVMSFVFNDTHECTT